MGIQRYMKKAAFIAGFLGTSGWMAAAVPNKKFLRNSTGEDGNEISIGGDAPQSFHQDDFEFAASPVFEETMKDLGTKAMDIWSELKDGNPRHLLNVLQAFGETDMGNDATQKLQNGALQIANDVMKIDKDELIKKVRDLSDKHLNGNEGIQALISTLGSEHDFHGHVIDAAEHVGTIVDKVKSGDFAGAYNHATGDEVQAKIEDISATLQTVFNVVSEKAGKFNDKVNQHGAVNGTLQALKEYEKDEASAKMLNAAKTKLQHLSGGLQQLKAKLSQQEHVQNAMNHFHTNEIVHNVLEHAGSSKTEIVSHMNEVDDIVHRLLDSVSTGDHGDVAHFLSSNQFLGTVGDITDTVENMSSVLSEHYEHLSESFTNNGIAGGLKTILDKFDRNGTMSSKVSSHVSAAVDKLHQEIEKHPMTQKIGDHLENNDMVHGALEGLGTSKEEVKDRASEMYSIVQTLMSKIREGDVHGAVAHATGDEVKEVAGNVANHAVDMVDKMTNHMETIADHVNQGNVHDGVQHVLDHFDATGVLQEKLNHSTRKGVETLSKHVNASKIASTMVDLHNNEAVAATLEQMGSSPEELQKYLGHFVGHGSQVYDELSKGDFVSALTHLSTNTSFHDKLANFGSHLTDMASAAQDHLEDIVEKASNEGPAAAVKHVVNNFGLENHASDLGVKAADHLQRGVDRFKANPAINAAVNHFENNPILHHGMNALGANKDKVKDHIQNVHDHLQESLDKLSEGRFQEVLEDMQSNHFHHHLQGLGNAAQNVTDSIGDVAGGFIDHINDGRPMDGVEHVMGKLGADKETTKKLVNAAGTLLEGAFKKGGIASNLFNLFTAKVRDGDHEEF